LIPLISQLYLDEAQKAKGEAVVHFCLTADYTPEAISALRNSPDTNRRDAAQQVCEVVGAKLVAWFARTANGPGALVIFETDNPAVPPALVSVAASSGILQNVRLERLLTQDELPNIRQSAQKIAEVYKTPGR
jgi:uncharacterized protein with GYD domain